MPSDENSPISNKKPTTERYEWMQATMQCGSDDK